MSEYTTLSLHLWLSQNVTAGFWNKGEHFGTLQEDIEQKNNYQHAETKYHAV
jgi:hypothetical protein